jgi:hypothetical protein
MSRVNATRDIVEQAPAAVAVFDDKMRCVAVSRRFLSDYELGIPPKLSVVRSTRHSQTCRRGGARFMSECWRARS